MKCVYVDDSKPLSQLSNFISAVGVGDRISREIAEHARRQHVTLDFAHKGAEYVCFREISRPVVRIRCKLLSLDGWDKERI